MRSTILSLNQYDPTFITSAIMNAIIIPPLPPIRLPANTSRTVMTAMRKTVFVVFIEFSRDVLYILPADHEIFEDKDTDRLPLPTPGDGRKFNGIRYNEVSMMARVYSSLPAAAAAASLSPLRTS